MNKILIPPAFWSALLITSLLLSGCKSSGKDDNIYPSRPITYLVPWAAGGMTDMTSRMMGAVLQKKIGQTVNVVNRTGGG